MFNIGLVARKSGDGELIANWNFRNQEGWLLGTGWQIHDGLYAQKSSGTASALEWVFPTALPPGSYALTVVTRSRTGGLFIPRILRSSGLLNSGSSQTSAGTYVFNTPISDGIAAVLIDANSLFNGTISSLSLKRTA